MFSSQRIAGNASFVIFIFTICLFYSCSSNSVEGSWDYEIDFDEIVLKDSLLYIVGGLDGIAIIDIT